MVSKKILALALSATMAFGMSMTAFADTLPAADSSAGTGIGNLEGYVTYDVTKVVLPTSASYDMTLDPQGLLNKANSTLYAAGTTVYFKNCKKTLAQGDTVFVADSFAGSDTSVLDGTDDFKTQSTTGYTTLHTLVPADTAAIGTEGYAYYQTGDIVYVDKSFGVSPKTAADAVLDGTDSFSATIKGDYTEAHTIVTGDTTALGTFKYTYSNTSDVLTIENRSTYDVDASVKVELKNSDGDDLAEIALAKQADLASATDPSLYIGLDVNGTTKAIEESGDSASTTASAVPMVAAAVNYAVGDIVYVKSADAANDVTGAKGTDWDVAEGATFDTAHTVAAADTGVLSTVKTAAVAEGYDLCAYDATTLPSGSTLSASSNGYYYEYAITSGWTATSAQKVEFSLTGATDTTADWSEVDEVVDTTVTYTLTKHSGTVAATTISGSSFSLSGNNTYTITWKTGMTTADKAIDSIQGSKDGTTYSNTLATASYSVSGNTLTIIGSSNGYIGTGGVGQTRYLKVNFHNGESVIITLTTITA